MLVMFTRAGQQYRLYLGPRKAKMFTYRECSNFISTNFLGKKIENGAGMTVGWKFYFFHRIHCDWHPFSWKRIAGSNRLVNQVEKELKQLTDGEIPAWKRFDESWVEKRGRLKGKYSRWNKLNKWNNQLFGTGIVSEHVPLGVAERFQPFACWRTKSGAAIRLADRTET